ncbi:MAG: hypothetical protein WD847_17410 [Pirellulales bacterium]
MIRRHDKRRTLLSKAEAAFREASLEVIQRARQTGTPVIVWKDGRIERLSIEQAELDLLQANEDSRPPTSDS